jgi:arginyl-tRNA--protein-N-Asp/Glu arginylyltransferase
VGGVWARRLEKVVRRLEECAAVVFEVYLDDEMRPYVELKRCFKTLEEAVKYVEEAKYLEEEGEVLDPGEFLLYLKHALGARVWSYASTTVLLLEYA